MKTRFYHKLYFYVLLAIVAGIITGHYYPTTGEKMGILSDVFLRLIKMIIAPVVFLTVTLGIAGLSDLKKAGRIGLKSILYFELVTTLAMIIGILVIHLVQPGAGINQDVVALDSSKVSTLVEKGKSEGLLYKIIPSNIIDPFLKGELLQVLFLALLTGVSLSALKTTGKKITESLEQLSRLVFKMVSYLMYLTPLAAFGAMATSIGVYGVKSLQQLGLLMLCVYITCIAFVIIVLGSIAWKSGFSIFKFIRFIKDEILIVLGTSSSETVLPRIMEKMEKAGCSRAVTGLVIPTGYSFNLDGTSIYLTMAALFIAQATNTSLNIGDLMVLLGVLMLTSKGAAAITGGGLVTLAATLETIDTIPLAGITLVIGVDRFMSEARAITNLIGNGVATIVISNWENETDKDKLKSELNNPS